MRFDLARLDLAGASRVEGTEALMWWANSLEARHGWGFDG
jgi:hypothetical protein